MHTYLRAVGFSKIQGKKQLEGLIGEIMTHPTNKYVHEICGKKRYVEFSKDFSKGMGITIRGTYDEKGFFHLDHYFPYLIPLERSVKEQIYVNKRAEDSAYNVLCDDMGLGVALIFYLINTVDYMNLENASRYFVMNTNVSLSGLSNEGKILLPILQDDKMLKRCNKKYIQKQKLITEAKKGNQAAIDSLTINEIDIYARIKQRIKKQDIYTIVDNSFYPCSKENDLYSMVGTIKEVYENENIKTKEKVYRFIIECNHVLFSVCINKNDLYGTPYVGARFKGNIWLQGKVEFN